MQRLILSRLGLGLILGAWLVASPTQMSAKPAAESRSRVAPFELKNLKGKNIRLADLKGKVVVISFWATWCAPCLQELGYLQNYFKRYKDDGLSVLAIATDGPETRSRVRSVARRKRWTIPVLVDAAGTAVSKMNPRGQTPYTMFVDREGRLAHVHVGYKNGDEVAYETLIKKLLAE